MQTDFLSKDEEEEEDKSLKLVIQPPSLYDTDTIDKDFFFFFA